VKQDIATPDIPGSPVPSNIKSEVNCSIRENSKEDQNPPDDDREGTLLLQVNPS
jgi:hypothetical protein